jgi:dipeptidyl aminopeptidase/acylaminoacyl peptidase
MLTLLVRHLFLSFVLFCSVANAATFTLDQVLSSPFPSQLVAAEHTARIAWVFNARGARNVWIADGPNFSARQLTHYSGDDGVPIAGLAITPDGHTVVFARGTETNETGRVADPTGDLSARKQTVWAMDVDGQAPRLLGEMGCAEEGCENLAISPDGQFVVWPARKQLWIAPVSGATPAHQLTELPGSSSAPQWSPDGRRIAFVNGRGDHSFVAIYELGGNSVMYLSPGVDRDRSPRWSPDGKQVAFERIPGTEHKVALIPLRPTPWSIWVADPLTGKGHVVWQSGDKLQDSYPSLTADNSFLFPADDRLVFASEQDGWNHLYSVPLAGGTPVLLTAGDYEVEDVTLAPDKKSILYTSNGNDIDRRHIWRVALPDGKPQPVTHGETMEWSPVQTGTGSYLACLGSTATSPAMPYRITSQGREMLAASALPSDFPSSQLVIPRQVVFSSEDGWKIHGQLFVPAGRTQPGPALVFMHGGPIRQMMLGFHYMDYYHNAYAMNQYLASQGYVVLSVNYRLGVMYGRAFRQPADGSWRGASEYKDITAAAKYLQSLPIVDAKRIGLWGGSYGGYLTAMGLARNSDVFAAGVDFHGVHDWSEFLSRWDENTSNVPPDLEAARKLAFQSSPNASVQLWKSPVLLIQGDDDRNVPFEQTVDLTQRLRENHVPLEVLVFPDEIHDFLMYKSWVAAYSATADFFAKWLKR